MSEELNLYGLVNKPPIDEIFNLDLVNKPPLVTEDDELAHFGILGMHWGIRRYQNPDGTLTPAGRRRVAKLRAKEAEKERKAAKKRAKMVSNPNEKYLNKNMDKFTNDELREALRRLDMKRSLETIKRDRIQIGRDKVDSILRYGDSINSALRFLNSDAGRAIRGKLGFGTEKIFNFFEQDKRARELEDKKLNFAYENKRKDLDSARNFEYDQKRKDADKARDYEYEQKRKAADKARDYEYEQKRKADDKARDYEYEKKRKSDDKARDYEYEQKRKAREQEYEKQREARNYEYEKQRKDDDKAREYAWDWLRKQNGLPYEYQKSSVSDQSKNAQSKNTQPNNSGHKKNRKKKKKGGR